LKISQFVNRIALTEYQAAENIQVHFRSRSMNMFKGTGLFLGLRSIFLQ